MSTMTYKEYAARIEYSDEDAGQEQELVPLQVEEKLRILFDDHHGQVFPWRSHFLERSFNPWHSHCGTNF